MSEKSNEACWYVVHTYSGYENKVKDTLEKSIKSSNMIMNCDCTWHFIFTTKLMH